MSDTVTAAPRDGRRTRRKVAVDPLTGCVIAAFPGDPYNTFDRQAAGNSTNSSSNYVSRQTSGCFPLS
jgi:hypothetical protein